MIMSTQVRLHLLVINTPIDLITKIGFNFVNIV